MSPVIFDGFFRRDMLPVSCHDNILPDIKSTTGHVISPYREEARSYQYKKFHISLHENVIMAVKQNQSWNRVKVILLNHVNSFPG